MPRHEQLSSCCKPGKDFLGAIWRNGAFAGEFGDPHIQNTDLEGGQTAPSIRTLAKIIRDLVKERKGQLSLMEKEDLQKVERIVSDLVLASEIDAEKDAVSDHKCVPDFVKKFQRRLTEMKDGQRLAVTGGWSDKGGGHAIMHVVWKTKDSYDFSVINTGQGVEYHPATNKWFPKKKHKVAITIKGIKAERFLDPAIWFLFWKLRLTHKKENDSEQMYEVLLPHLANGPLAQAVEAADKDDLCGEYETIQRSGTCYYRCILSTLRFLMKRDGFNEKQRKQFLFQIRCAYLDRVLADLKAMKDQQCADGKDSSTSSGLLEDSDVRMINVACRQTAMAALKELKRGSLDAKGLQVVRTQVKTVQETIKNMLKSDVAFQNRLGELNMRSSDEYIGYSGFGLIADKRKTDGLKGGPTEAVPELFVDLYDDSQPRSFAAIQRYLTETKDRCDRLRAKTSVSAGSIACHQITCLIQAVFTMRIPIPKPQAAPTEEKSSLEEDPSRKSTCPFANATPTNDERMAVLKAIHGLLIHYIAATLSTNLDRADEAARAVTSMAILAVFDAVVRMRTTVPDGKKDEKSSGEAKTKKKNTHDVVARLLCGTKVDAASIAGTKGVKGYSICLTSFQGYQLRRISDRMLFTDPHILDTRHRVFDYFERMPFSKSPALFSWKPEPPRGGLFSGQYKQPTFQVQEDDTTMKFVKELLDQCGLMYTLPPRKKRGRVAGHVRGAQNPDAMTDLERQSRWIMGEAFDQAPEVLLLRDVIFLHRLILEPAALLKIGNAPFRSVSLWYLSQATPKWDFHDCNRDGTVSLLRVAICNEKHNIKFAPGYAQKSPASLSLLGTRNDADEDAVLQKTELQRFGDTLSEEESERLMTYLTTPYLAIPLVLEFFAKQRVGALLNPWLRDIFESVLFEPRAYVSDSFNKIDKIPVESKQRDPLLGTSHGVLMREAKNAPRSLLGPLAKIVSQTLELCIGDYTSTFATLLMRIIRITYFILSFVRHARQCHKTPKDSTENRILRLLGPNGATAILHRWLVESETAGDVERSTEMHSHLALLHAIRGTIEKEESSQDMVSTKTVSDLCCSSAFVLSWHSEAKSAKFVIQHLSDKKRAGQAIPLLPVPLHDVFLIYEKSRADICHCAQKADSAMLDQLLGRVASVSLQRANPGEMAEVQWRGWASVASKPLICSKVVESSHPYKPLTDYYETVRFPGTPYISIYFDEKCATEEYSDFVTIYKDESCTSFWGKERKFSGPAAGEWPGAGGRPPLVIPADSFVVHFHSDRSVEDWGFRLTAAAPVSVASARLLSQEQDENKQPVGVNVAQRALMETMNDLEAARQYLRKNLKEIKAKIAKELKEEKLEASSSSSRDKSVGLYRDPMGTVQVNLQTGEVYLRNRMLMPVPTDIANHSDFSDVFEVAQDLIAIQQQHQQKKKKKKKDKSSGSSSSSSSLFCAIVENNLNRKLMTIVHGQHVYEIGSWTPIVSNEMAQNMSAVGSISLDAASTITTGSGDKKTQNDDGQKDNEGSESSSTPTQAVGRLGGLPEQKCLNMPRRSPGSASKLLYDGKTFIAYSPGSAGWLSELLDPILDQSVDKMEMEARPKVWIDTQGLRSCRDSSSSSIDNVTGGVSPALCAQMLMYVSPQGDLEELKGHPGGFFEVQAFRTHKTFTVYYLAECGRRVHRQCVFSSDSRFCLHDLEQDPRDRDNPAKPGLRFAGGGMFDGLLNKDGSMSDRPGVGKLSNNAVGSVVIRRNRLVAKSDRDLENKLKKEAEAWGDTVSSEDEEAAEGEYEEYIPARFLSGLIPDILTRQYQFWRTGPCILRGYPRPDSKTVDSNTVIVATLKIQSVLKVNGRYVAVDSAPTASWKSVRENAARKAGARLAQVPPHDCYTGLSHNDEAILENEGIGEWVANIYRIPYYGKDSTSQEEEEEKSKEKESKSGDGGSSNGGGGVLPEPMLLLNLVRSQPSSLGHRLKKVLTRIENLSYVLVWTRSSPKQTEEECEISLVELPRLGARFETREQDGKSVLASLDYDGLYLTESPDSILSKHANAIPHAVVLNNSRQEYFLMVPNYGITRPKIKQCPFSTHVVLSRGKEWSQQVKTRYYVYPIHLSGTFVLSRSLSASFYLLLLRLMARDYAAASKLLSTCSTDTAFTEEEKWIVSLIKNTEEDSHPDAHACRLRLACICKGCGESPPVKVKADKEGYLKKFPHVSVVCRLTQDEEIQLGIAPDRLRYLQAIEQSSRLSKALEFPAGPCRSKQGGALWQDKVVQAVKKMAPVLERGVGFYLKYSQPSGSSLHGAALVTLIEEIFDDSLTGSKMSRGLLVLYQMLSGTLKPLLWPDVHHDFPQHSFTLTKLLVQMKYLEQTKMGKKPPSDDAKVAYGMLGPLLHAIERGVEIKKTFPELPFFKISTVLEEGCPTNSHPGLGMWVKDHLTAAARYVKTQMHAPKFPPPPEVNETTHIPANAEILTRPEVSDCSASQRHLPLDAKNQNGDENQSDGDLLHVSDRDRKAFFSMPLSAIDFSSDIAYQLDPNADSILAKLPFTVSTSNPVARSQVARKMLKLMEHDLKTSAVKAKGKTRPRLAYLTPDHLDAIRKDIILISGLDGNGEDDAHKAEEEKAFDGDNPLPIMAIPSLRRTATIGSQAAAILGSALEKLSKLKNLLEKLRGADFDAIRQGSFLVEQMANVVTATKEDSKEKKGEELKDRAAPADGAATNLIAYSLEKFCGKRATASFEHIASLFLSSREAKDMQRINPFLSRSDIEKLMAAVAAVLFRCTRLSHCNRTLDVVKKLESSIELVIVKRLEEGWLRGGGSVYEILVPTPQMLLHAAKQCGYDEAKTRALTKDLLRKESQLISSTDRSLYVKEKGLPERHLPAVVAVAFHFHLFDAKKTRTWLQDSSNSLELLKLARRGCYQDGIKLWKPSPTGDRQPAMPSQKMVGGGVGGGANGTAPGGGGSAGGRKKSSTSLGAMVHIMEHTAKDVAGLLTASRGYTTQMSLTTGTFDPRFLAFEFMAGFMMRPRQVEIIYQFLASARTRQSSVRQMIMGAGKTSVVSPMLTLLLANGRVLVSQVVPKALLAQTRSVMRNVFSNVISKAVYTFNFDRGSDTANSIKLLEALYTKLDRARKQRAVVCTTPEAVKSLMLKYVDLLQSVEAASPILSLPKSRVGSGLQLQRSGVLAKDLRSNALKADAIKRILKLFGKDMGGVALLDEVDLILHPLKSELNFPIGPKEKLPLGPERWEFPMHLLEAFFYDVSGGRVPLPDFRPDTDSLAVLRDIANAMRQGEEQKVVQTSPHPVVLQKSFYQSHLKMAVGRWAMIWLRAQPCIQADIETAASSPTATGTELEMKRVLSESKRKERREKEDGKHDDGGNDDGGGGDDDDDGSEPASSFSNSSRVQELMLAYILDNTSSASQKLLVKEAYEMAESRLSPKSIQLLNLARDWTNSFLPHCISKINRVAYGLLHPHHIDKWALMEGKPPEISAARRLLAVPFIGLDVPSRAAEFAHPEIQIGLSVLAYRYEGLRRRDVRAVAQQLKEKLATEQGPYVQRASRIKFQEWLQLARDQRERAKEQKKKKIAAIDDDDEGYEVLPLELFQYQDDKQLEVLYRAITTLPDSVGYFLREQVFDRVMRHQATKLRASGADLGSDVIFGLRLGFSGTPSDLLPKELRPCHYEPGSEAKILRVLTDPHVVTSKYIQGNWSVETLLLEVASPGRPTPYRALIDTGALITGMTNEQVARFLLKNGLLGVDACVYLDESDRKVVVDRTGGRPVPLSRCGVSPERYFTFYDQVHTTGMDIKQALDAKAAVTLGKDMTFRDYKQGCYRLRGLAKGQTLCVLIVGEVRQLIRKASNTGNILCDVVAWLTTNSMRSENLQHLALCGQLLNNAWRRQAWVSLIESAAPSVATAGELLPSRFRRAITDEKEIQLTLKEHSVLTDADREAEKKKKENEEAKKRLDQILISIRASGKQLPIAPQDLIAQAGSLAKGVGALADIAKGMGVEILDPKELEEKKKKLEAKGHEQQAHLRLIVKSVRTSKTQLPVPLSMIMSQFGNDPEAKIKGLTDFVTSCGITIPKEAFDITVALSTSSAQTKEQQEKKKGEETKEGGGDDVKAEAQGQTTSFKISCTPLTFISDLREKIRVEGKLPEGAKVQIQFKGKELKDVVGSQYGNQKMTVFDLGFRGGGAAGSSASTPAPAATGGEGAAAKPADLSSCTATWSVVGTEDGAAEKKAGDSKNKAAGAGAGRKAGSSTVVAGRKPVAEMSDEEKLRFALELSYGKKATMDIDPVWATRCIALFREPLDHDISEKPPTKVQYSARLREQVAARRDFLTDPAQMRVVEDILNEVETEELSQRGSGDKKKTGAVGNEEDSPEEKAANTLEFDTEMVQEQEKEQEQENKQVIEKVRINYASASQAAVVWHKEDLANAGKLIPRVFYPLRTFSLNKKTGPGLPFPKSILLSENFAPLLHRSDLARRMKNASVLISWRPQITEGAKEVREVKGKDADWMSAAYVEAVAEMKEKEAASNEEAKAKEDEEKLEPPPPPPKEYCVTISLAEAESLKRALEDGVPGLEGTSVSMTTIDGLELFSLLASSKEAAEAAAVAAAAKESSGSTGINKSELALLVEKYTRQLKDAGVKEEEIPGLATSMAKQVSQSNISGGGKQQQQTSSFEDGRQCIRFFDNEMWFDDDGIIRVLRALSSAPESRRRIVFDNMVSARRRDRTKWDGMPVAQVFSYSDEKHLMRMRDLALRVTCAVIKGKMSLFDIFRKFDANGDGWLSREELTNALMKLNIGLSEEECAQLLRQADSSQDGYLNYREFATRFGAYSSASKGEDGKGELFRALNPGKLSQKRRKALPLNLLPSAAASAKNAKATTTTLDSVGEEEEKFAHMSYAELSALGSMSLASGGMAYFHDDGLVSTRPGYRPTLCARGVLIQSGRYYYEVTVVTAGRGCLGWADAAFRPNYSTSHGVGDDKNSWGYDGLRQLAIHDGKESADAGLPKWSTGDVIGVKAEITSRDKMTISYYLNGVLVGAPFQNVTFKQHIIPAISFESAFQFRVNFGMRPWRHVAPDGSRSIRSWARNKMQQIHALNAGALFGKLKPTTGDAKMSIKYHKDNTVDVIVNTRPAFPTAVLQGCLLTSGKWYWEYKLKRAGIAQIGWCDLHFYASSGDGVGVGDDKHSWGYDGQRICLWFNGQHPYGKMWKTGDIIGVGVDIDSRSCRFWQNGDPLGAAAENMEFIGGLAPGITLNNSCTVTVNFGTAPFAQACPPGYLSIAKWLELYNPAATASLVSPSKATLQSEEHDDLKELAVPGLSRSISQYTRPSSELDRIPLRASSGYSQALINGRTVGASSHYPSIVADRVSLTRGKWYYEAKLEQLSGKQGGAVMTIGWCDSFFFGSSITKRGVGDDAHSWGWGVTDGINGLPELKHDSKRRLWSGPVKSGTRFKKGDIIGCALDVDAKTVQFSFNGSWGVGKGTVSVAFENISFEKGLIPALSTSSMGTVRINFGARKFKHAPPDEQYRPVHEWFSAHRSGKLHSVSPSSLPLKVDAPSYKVPTPSRSPSQEEVKKTKKTQSDASDQGAAAPKNDSSTTTTEVKKGEEKKEAGKSPSSSSQSSTADLLAATQQLSTLRDAIGGMQAKIQEASGNINKMLASLRNLEDLGAQFAELQVRLDGAKARLTGFLEGTETGKAPSGLDEVMKNTQVLIDSLDRCFKPK
eukprot:jgi/Bigna1/85176/estExt_fgenesh1_pg.C_20373